MTKPLLIIKLEKGYIIVPVDIELKPSEIAEARAFSTLDGSSTYSRDGANRFIVDYFEPPETSA